MIFDKIYKFNLKDFLHEFIDFFNVQNFGFFYKYS